ncbi:MAG: hypothetical protein UX45_C0033G0010 [Candidatus Uhrbacteria bacterium GW2011_GWF2_46_218]|uniref:Uncharacterized protein n=1 Tax=Candidatus Uhrbacteria bacterium GW2011_GWF2_46_218 TaxID=1619001 RepID=A0A0G1PDP4_9BACT|nr:MAG: hypothetical protein UX45_C0033G0010 [Candidatus Uhrbacteria bacterium GW2011_GWF2_46_218]
MADKVVIVEIQYDVDAAIQNVVKLNDVVEVQKTKQVALKENLKAGVISWEEYNKKLTESQVITGKANAERKTTIQSMSAEKGSLNELRAAVKTLTDERNKLNLNTAEGRKRVNEINKTLDQHNAIIKENVDGLTKQKIGIGGYGDALKNIPGPIGGVINGIVGMTKASLAFIATPIGMVIAAIGLALGALMKYFKGSEEGQNRLNKVTNIAKGIWEALMNVVEKVGEIIFDVVSKPRESIEKLGNLIKENLINRFEAFGVMGKAIVKILKGDFKEGFKELAEGGVQAVTGVTDSFDKMKNAVESVNGALKGIVEDTKKNIAMSIKLSDIQAAIDKRERAMIVDREKTRVSVAEKILQSKRKDLNSEAQRLVLLEAAKKEIIDLVTREEALATMRLEAAKLNLKINGEEKEFLDAVAEAEANLISKKAEGLEERRRIESQISILNLEAVEEVINLDDMMFDNFEDGMKTSEEQDIKRAEGIIERNKFLRDLRQEDLDQALSDMQRIIDATQDMADARITIMQDAFAKIATINWDEVEGTKEGFIAIGQAASGLTNLIIAGQQKAFNNLEANKQKELDLYEGNKAMQDAINRRYARKELELKKKQFTQDKIKAIVDSSIATILAVLKAGIVTPLGIAIGILGAAGTTAIAAKRFEPSLAEGGAIIGGLPHSQGGTHFIGSDGSRFEAERGEAMFVMKKDATAEIAALSAINEQFGGRSWTGRPAAHLAEGGEVSTQNLQSEVAAEFRRTPIVVKVGDIVTGMTDYNNTKNVGVL